MEILNLIYNIHSSFSILIQMLIIFQYIFMEFQLIFILFRLIFIKSDIFFYKTALHIACENENLKILELLLKHPAVNINLYLEIQFYFKNVFTLI